MLRRPGASCSSTAACTCLRRPAGVASATVATRERAAACSHRAMRGHRTRVTTTTCTDHALRQRPQQGLGDLPPLSHYYRTPCASHILPLTADHDRVRAKLLRCAVHVPPLPCPLRRPVPVPVQSAASACSALAVRGMPMLRGHAHGGRVLAWRWRVDTRAFILFDIVWEVGVSRSAKDGRGQPERSRQGTRRATRNVSIP